EKEFTARLNKKGEQNEYGNLLSDFEKDYKAIEKYAVSYEIFVESFLRNVELLTTAYRLHQLEQVYNARGEQSFMDRKNTTITSLEGFYKDFNATVDEKVFEKVVEYYIANTPQEHLPEGFKSLDITALTKEIYSESKITSYEGVQELLSGNAEEIIKKLNADKGYTFVKKAAEHFLTNVNPQYGEINTKISATQRVYMKAILESFPDARILDRKS